MQTAFHTANFFARASNYQTSIDDWGAAERRIIENFSLMEFRRICEDIYQAGFKNIELWMGHAFPKHMTSYWADELKDILKEHDLTAISYSCSLGDPIHFPHWTRLCFETSKMLGIDLITSGISKEAAPYVYELCKEFDIRVAVENHPEKHPDEIRQIIGEYGDYIGAGVDTGWFGTQGFPAEEALSYLKNHLFHVHLKDVDASGRHYTVEPGKGIVDIEACISVLKDIGYSGFLSIENEAADRNPLKECENGRILAENLLSSHTHSS
ncbi:sugar phosphate isomerase/epimerase family protein [Thalassobacillus pellis]|uniref:sugar phosphate isomerase/epimerase family protein n=1 Tax=Thalassobacillus pellis TaxID=748008 RepID=UPI0019605616|nr:sugar phosphate isomerase/epimerase family protein [Thalassobacillus pellis]MBM7554150.1 sugar phosphate isomerase/epimerase [Thalassobacillus pellis]